MNRSVRLEKTRTNRVHRSRWARVVLALVVLTLCYSLGRLQLLQSEEYAVVAKTNRLRPLPIRAPRGTIYDRHGNVVAENVVGYQVQLMPAPEDSLRKQVALLQPVLGLDSLDVRRVFRTWEMQRHLPLMVSGDASQRAVAQLQERRDDFPWVVVTEYPKRMYSAGEAVSNIVGYVAEINQAELDMSEYSGYRQGRWIGKTGLERQYERHLSGEPGIRYLEIDAKGRIKNWLPEELGVPPLPGEDLHLHLDLDLQRYVSELFKDAEEHYGKPVTGGFAAIDPRTGGVLALYSSPTYDPNLFTGGISTREYRRLADDPRKPLLDRATGSRQPPGSVFKLSHASMALQLGLITPDEYMPIACAGGMGYQGRYAKCHSVHGRQNMYLGIKNSCDVYFYQVGIRIGLRRFMEMGVKMGLNGKTGIDLPTEINSIYPKSMDWMESWLGYKPPENEIMSLSIGQGVITQSPLMVAHSLVPLARADGKAPAPRLADTGQEAPFTLDYGITREQIEELRKALRMVTFPGGTAALTRLKGWDFMGKTGTAQNSHGDDHGWFVGLGGPTDGPTEIIAAILIEGGLHGSDTSGWVGNAVNFYLSRKYDRPFVRYPTPRERFRKNLPVGAWVWNDPLVHYDNLGPAPGAAVADTVGAREGAPR
ncbi:MAG TPA: penicillin-binding transpeptidase domain-containing protein [Longimicrobiales bacterium]|nr:penicillin-binding transpeptidase domain-containing protein [Longimicrobiales bacterium]